jgi:hypothetical protein
MSDDDANATADADNDPNTELTKANEIADNVLNVPRVPAPPEERTDEPVDSAHPRPARRALSLAGQSWGALAQFVDPFRRVCLR